MIAQIRERRGTQHTDDGHSNATQHSPFYTHLHVLFLARTHVVSSLRAAARARSDRIAPSRRACPINVSVPMLPSKLSLENSNRRRVPHDSYSCFTRLGNMLKRLTPSHPGRVSKLGQLIWVGVPQSCQILSSWSRSEDPGRMGFLENISPRTHLKGILSSAKYVGPNEKDRPNAPHIHLAAVLTRTKK